MERQCAGPREMEALGPGSPVGRGCAVVYQCFANGLPMAAPCRLHGIPVACPTWYSNGVAGTCQTIVQPMGNQSGSIVKTQQKQSLVIVEQCYSTHTLGFTIGHP